MLLEALVAGLPVLVTDVCGYAHYITDADCGRVVPQPVRAAHARPAVDADAERRAAARDLEPQRLAAASADLYSMPQKAADVILGEQA